MKSSGYVQFGVDRDSRYCTLKIVCEDGDFFSSSRVLVLDAI